MKPERKPGKDVPEQLADKENPEEVGATHGEATGAWRVLRNSMIIVVAVFALVLIVYNLGWA